MDSRDDQSASNSIDSIDDLEVTGLRSKRLLAMVVCLLILFFLTALILILNILIITTLRMDASGVRYLRFHQSLNKQSGQLEKTVEMRGERVQFDRVVSSGKVVGFPDKDLLLHAPRILASAHPNDTTLVLGEKSCRLDGVDAFQVVSPTGRTMFSARHPTVSIDKRIRRLSAERIITNKIRAAVDEPLRIDANDVVLRGNEQVRIDARNINFEAMSRIAFNISRDGSLSMRGRIRLGDGATSLPHSTSPSLSASVDGLRLCACAQNTHKLFVVPVNKPCFAQHSFCA